MNERTHRITGEERPWVFPLWVMGVYMVVAVAWILFSDRFVAAIASTPESLAKMQMYKGTAFVLVTALLLFLILCHESRRRLKRDRTIRRQAILLDLADAAVFVYQWNGAVTYWNRGAERLYGWSREHAVGKRLSEIFPDNGESEAWSELEPILLKEGFWRGECRRRSRDGLEVDVDMQLTLVRNVHGEPESVMLVGLDVTERKVLEMQLWHAQKLESIGSLAAGISHDFNNILAIVGGYSEMLLMSPEPECDDRRRMAEQIQVAARRGTGLVRRIAAFVRSREPVKTEIDLAGQVEELVGMLASTFPSAIEINTEVEQGIPPVTGDPDQLQQVILNLSVNARDAMEDGGTLTLRLRKANFNEAVPGGGANLVCLEVQDTGGGIPAEVQSSLFEPFVTTKREGRGTGLGLSVVDGIVRSHGGWINLRTSKGEGTTFFVYLPCTGTTEQVPDSSSAAEPLLSANGREDTVIIVGGADPALRSATETLRKRGYRVTSELNAAKGERNGDSATRIAVIVDTDSPGVEGESLIREIRTGSPEIPVVAIVGSISEDEERKLLTLGAADIIRKPYGVVEVITALEEALIVSDKRIDL